MPGVGVLIWVLIVVAMATQQGVMVPVEVGRVSMQGLLVGFHTGVEVESLDSVNYNRLI